MKTLNFYSEQKNNKNGLGSLRTISRYLKATSVLLFVIFFTTTKGWASYNVTSPAPQIPTGITCPGNTNVQIYAFRINTFGGGGGGFTLTSLNFTTAGSYTTSDISNFHLYYNTISNNFLFATLVTGGTIAASGPGAQSFSAITRAIGNNATVYFWITCDVQAGAANNTVSVSGITGSTPGLGFGNNTTTAGNTITINLPPVAISGNSTICFGGGTTTTTLSDATPGGTWSSSSSSVATINIAGFVLTSRSQGTTTVTHATGCGANATAVITVNAVPAPIGANTQMCAGGSAITLTNTSTNGTWSGGTTGIATVTVGSSVGLVTPGATQGTTTISYSNGCGSAAIATATVNANPVAIGGNVPLCENGATITLTNASTNGTWSSSVLGVASVNNAGLVTSGAASGTTTITYDNGCGAAVTTTVTVKSTPLVHTFTGGGAYCAGDPGVPVGLTLSDVGISYQLYRSPSTAVGSPVIGTGAAISFGIDSIPGVYYAIATNGTTSCTTYLSGITISINPLPDTFRVTGGGSYCTGGTGDSVGLNGSVLGINYQLYNGASPVGSPVAGTGSAISFGLHTAGVYTAIATNNTTHCVKNMQGSATVIAIPLPAVDTVTGGGHYCSGDSGVVVSLSGSETGVTYQLYNGIFPVGTAVSGTGAALSFGLHTFPGTYTVRAHNTATTCNNNMWGSVTITIDPLPNRYNVTETRLGNFCVGDTGVHIGLDSSNLGIRYQLYRGATAVGSGLLGTNSALDYGRFTTAGTYKIVATDTATGCIRTMRDSAVVKSNPVVFPAINISVNPGVGNAVCLGSVDTFKARTRYGGTGPTFTWKVNRATVGTSDSSYYYIPVNGDTVRVMLTSNELCPVPDTAVNTMIVNVDTPAAPSVFIDVSPITSINPGTSDTLRAFPTNGGPTPKYQWYKNSTIIAGATNAVYISASFVNHDSVTCRMISSGGCGGDTTFNSVIITVYPIGITQVTHGNDIRLIPNPNKGEFMIRGTLGSQIDEQVSVEITNMIGQVIYRNNVLVRNGVVNERIQLSNTLANGMYILNLRSENENNIFRFVIEQ